MLRSGSGASAIQNGYNMLALDSNVFIYFFEKNEQYYKASESIILDLLHGKSDVVCSTLVITELFAGDPNFDMSSLNIKGLHIVPPDRNIAVHAGKLRNQLKVKTPDAIHLSTAILSGASKFITNDKKLLAKKVGGIKIRGL